MDHSLSDYSALGIPQARILSWAVPIIKIHTLRNTSEVDKLRYWAVKECKCPLKREKKWKVKVAPLCPTLCDPMDYTIHGILQARILEWVELSFFRGSSQPRDWTQTFHISGVFFTSWATMEVPLKRCTAKIANNPKVIFLIWLCQVCICTYVLICVHVGRALLLSLHIYIFLTVASNGFT